MEPIAQKVSAASATAASIMGALYAHFSSASLLWRVAENAGVPIEAGTNPGEDGFLLTPKGFETFQINFRRSTNSVYVSLDPQRALTITDPTNPSANASSEWSDETSIGQLNLADISGDVYVVEYVDALTILVIPSSGAGMASASHAGRVYTPLFTSYVDDGVDGLAVLGRVPLTSDTAGSFYWMSTSTTTSATSLWRTGTTTWVEGATSHEWQADATTMSALGRSEPVPVLCFRDPDTYFGVMKYVFSVSPGDAPWGVLNNDDVTTSYLHVGTNAATSYGVVIAWDRFVQTPVV